MTNKKIFNCLKTKRQKLNFISDYILRNLKPGIIEISITDNNCFFFSPYYSQIIESLEHYLICLVGDLKSPTIIIEYEENDRKKYKKIKL